MKGPTKNQIYSPTGWLRMHIWRMSLRRTKSAIISWAGSFNYLIEKNQYYEQEPRIAELAKLVCFKNNLMPPCCQVNLYLVMLVVSLNLGWDHLSFESDSDQALFFTEVLVLNANSVDPDQMPCSATSDMFQWPLGPLLLDSTSEG